MKKSLFALLLLIPISVNISGCCDSGGSSSSNAARVRVLHASPDASDLDILVDDDTEWADVAYKEGSWYRKLSPGERNFKIEVSDTSQTLVDELATVEQNTRYSLIAVGFAAEMEMLLLEDDDTDPDEGYARVRVVHGSPSQPAVDIYITEPDTPLEFAVPVLQFLEFEEVSTFLELEEGEYRIRITLSGEIEPIYDSGTVTLEEDSISTAVVVDATGGVSPISLVVLTDDSQEPVMEIPATGSMLRLIHASPDTSFVDVLLDDTEVISTVLFKAASNYKVVDSGTQSLEIEEGTGTTLIDAMITLQRGKNYTLFLMNFKATIEAVLLEDDTTSPPANKAKVRFVHASPDAPLVDFLVDDTVKVSYVPFKFISSYMEFYEGDRAFGVNEAGTSNILIGPPFSTIERYLEDGKAYTFMAADELADIAGILYTDN